MPGTTRLRCHSRAITLRSMLLLWALAAFSALCSSCTTVHDAWALHTWNHSASPVKLFDGVYFVGTKGIAAYLLDTGHGECALLGGGPADTTATITNSITHTPDTPHTPYTLSHIKYLLVNHAHFDHVGTLRYFKDQTHATVFALEQEQCQLASGDINDYSPLLRCIPWNHFEPVYTDRVLHDREQFKLGDLDFTVFRTPGHSRGCATYVTTLHLSDGKNYRLIFADGTKILPLTRLFLFPSYPGISADYKRTFALLESLKTTDTLGKTPDAVVYLPYHTDDFNLEEKFCLAKQGLPPVTVEKDTAFIAKQRRRIWLRPFTFNL